MMGVPAYLKTYSTFLHAIHTAAFASYKTGCLLQVEWKISLENALAMPQRSPKLDIGKQGRLWIVDCRGRYCMALVWLVKGFSSLQLCAASQHAVNEKFCSYYVYTQSCLCNCKEVEMKFCHWKITLACMKQALCQNSSKASAGTIISISSFCYHKKTKYTGACMIICLCRLQYKLYQLTKWHHFRTNIVLKWTNL